MGSKNVFLLLGTLILFFGCDLFGIKETTTTTTPQAGSVMGSPHNGATVPIDQFTGLSWETIQSDKVTEWTLVTDLGTNQLVTTAAGGNTTTGTPVIVVKPTAVNNGADTLDDATTAKLYFDVWFGDTAQNLKKVFTTSNDEEVALASINTVTAATILSGYNIPRFDVGQTYYWTIIATDSLGNKFSTGLLSFAIIPPANYNEIVLSRDAAGWYLLWYYLGSFPTTIGDLYFSTTSTFSPSTTAVLSNVDGREIAGNTTFKVYLSALTGFTLAASTTYYAKFVAKDKAVPGLSYEGIVSRIVSNASISDTSFWNFLANTSYHLNATTSTTVNSTDVTLVWNDIASIYGAPSGSTYEWSLYVGTSATALNLYRTNADITDAGTTISTTFKGLYNTPYFTRVDLKYYPGGSSSAVTTYSSPVTLFTTPTFTGGTTYNFNDSASSIPSLAATSNDPASLETDGTVVQSGNPYPSLQLASTQVITTSADGTVINPYKKATFSFGFKATSRANVFTLKFDNALSGDTFNASTYSNVTPSAQYLLLNGLVIVLKYYADDPATATAGDPVFKFYGYKKDADNSVDTDLVTAGTQGDADANPDVIEFDLGSFETYTGSPAQLTSSLLPQWNTLAVTIDTTATSNQATISLNGGTAVNLDVTNFKNANVADYDNVLYYGLTRFTLTAGSTVFVDNVAFSVTDTSYTRGF